MNLSWLLAGLLAFAAILGIVRLLWWQRRATEPARAWRLVLLVLAQPLYALLLYFVLMPPLLPGRTGTMVVLTAGASSPRDTATASGDVLVALPEAPAVAGAERVPDLATALRRHPGAQRLHVSGAGLEARDREAARGHALDFIAAPLPRGVVALALPEPVSAGSAFTVGGRVHGVAGAVVELRDPAGRRLDAATVSARGDFVLGGTVRAPGLVNFRLHVFDRRRTRVEEIDIPVQVIEQPAPRVLVLAGAPNPEWKYLRRWMADAGLEPHVQMQVGAGLQLGDAPLPLNAGTFARFDLVVLDDRAWAALGESSRAALVAALREGLGVLLRVEGPLPESTRRQLREVGMVVSGGAENAEVRLSPAAHGDDDALRARRGAGSRDAPVDADATDVPVLGRRALRNAASDAVALLRDADGVAVADWRAEGRGRIGVWPLTDTHRLVLGGRGDRHAEIWSEAFARLARPRREAAPVIPSEAWVGERARLCGVTGNAQVVAPDGAVASLLPDPASGAASCAGYWPGGRGWHRLRQDGREWAFMVRAADEAPGLRAAAKQAATQRLVGTGAPAGNAVAGPARRGSAWPWWWAWLGFGALLWWFERSRLGRAAAQPA
ncbi:carboxypeptidase regulatory-like domain-containing protein [Pseudoxanthomonas beigongshangi]